MAKCQKSYFSKVLSGKADLNLEQAMRLAIFWQLNQTETNYFLELIIFERTDFAPLKKQVQERLAKIRGDADNLAKRLEGSKELSPGNAAIYYSSWIWSAIHVLVGIENYQTVDAISHRLNLPQALVQSHLSRLAEMGLVQCKGNRWSTIPGHFHLPRESSLTALNHGNWRQRATLDSQHPGSDGIHYTCIQSHSQEDFTKIKEALLAVLDKHRLMIEPSPNEELTCICLDFFRVF